MGVVKNWGQRAPREGRSGRAQSHAGCTRAGRRIGRGKEGRGGMGPLPAKGGEGEGGRRGGGAAGPEPAQRGCAQSGAGSSITFPSARGQGRQPRRPGVEATAQGRSRETPASTFSRRRRRSSPAPPVPRTHGVRYRRRRPDGVDGVGELGHTRAAIAGGAREKQVVGPGGREEVPPKLGTRPGPPFPAGYPARGRPPHLTKGSVGGM